jgi:hypothetical protein
MSRRRSRRDIQSNDKMRGILLGVGGAILLGSMAGGAYFVRQSKIPIDATTNCPTAGPRAINVFIIDRSDPISPQQATRVRQEIVRLRDNAQFGERLDFYVAGGDNKKVLEPLLQICSPKRPDDASIVYENPELITRRYREQFVEKVDKTIDGLLTVSRADSSPIMESIRAAAIESLGSLPTNSVVPVKVTIVSDMIQNSPMASQFRSKLEFDTFRATLAWPSVRADLKRANVNVLYLLRREAMRGGTSIQDRGHQLFWEQYIQASGGHLENMEPL